MIDKTPLERDLECYELSGTPVTLKVFIILLIIGLCSLGYYTFTLKQQLSKKEQELELMKKEFQTEKLKLMEDIKKIQKTD